MGLYDSDSPRLDIAPAQSEVEKAAMHVQTREPQSGRMSSAEFKPPDCDMDLVRRRSPASRHCKLQTVFESLRRSKNYDTDPL
jgi:hypothetical protein